MSLSGLQLCAYGGLGGLAEPDPPLSLGVLVLQPLEATGLAQRLGTQRAQGGGEGFAVFGVALSESNVSISEGSSLGA